LYFQAIIICTLLVGLCHVILPHVFQCTHTYICMYMNHSNLKKTCKFRCIVQNVSWVTLTHADVHIYDYSISKGKKDPKLLKRTYLYSVHLPNNCICLCVSFSWFLFTFLTVIADITSRTQTSIGDFIIVIVFMFLLIIATKLCYCYLF